MRWKPWRRLGVWRTPELPRYPDLAGFPGNKDVVAQGQAGGGPAGRAGSAPPCHLPALFCLSGAAQSALVLSRAEVGQGDWAEPPEWGAGSREVQRVSGTCLGSHNTGLMSAPHPDGTPVSPAQGMQGITPAPLQSFGVVLDVSASLRALHPSLQPQSQGCMLEWLNPGEQHPTSGPGVWVKEQSWG